MVKKPNWPNPIMNTTVVLQFLLPRQTWKELVSYKTMLINFAQQNLLKV